MFKYLAKKWLNLAELSNHSTVIRTGVAATFRSSGLSDPGALRRYGAAAEPEEDSEEARVPRTKYGTLRRRQVEVETEAWEKAAEEYRDLVATMCEKKLAPNLPYVKGLLLGWFEPLRDAIAEAQKKGTKKKGCTNTYARYLVALPPDMTAVIAMHKLLGLIMSSTGFVRIAQASIQIGEAVEHEARILRFLDETKKAEIDSGDKQQRLRKAITELLGKNKVQKARKIVKQQDSSKPWGLEGQLRAGSRLIELLMETAFIQPPVRQLGDFPPDLRPAFIHNIRADPKTGKGFGVIECDPLVLSGLQNTARHMVNPVIPYMPMLVPPKKWVGYDKGAHLYLPSYVMRTHGSKQQRQLIKRAPRRQLKLVYEALDTLGSTRWRVNNRMLGVIDTIWSSGGGLAGLISRDEIPLPVKPDTEEELEIRKWWRKVKCVKKENKERNSQQCDIELRLSAARKMKDEEGFYYPHNLDFRGRAYPMHPYLNHLASDLSRGILEFAEGRPLGKSGLRWLKIHLASLYSGVDKLSHDRRVAFTENHIRDIFDSADRPLEGKRWWMESEDPFQCLATCMNLAEALRSPSPETTISHMPVHQDGSCNGLQHYAALGRDKVGATAVNLVAGEKPVDVYAGVASRVLDIMRRDAMDDPESNPNASHARRLIDQVDRKLVKQTVMTSVYGVTYIGARDQIQKRLKERDAIADSSELFAVSSYAAKTVRLAIGEMFEAAKSIMAWLSDCAKVIASDNRAVQWTTPVGLPVVQPYRKFGTRRVKTTLHSLSLKTETDQIMASRQRSAFPPNFVHSLDGSHMMMTALACRKAGLNFAGVHDSYWTHACDVDTMNVILREKFVELYEAPILEKLLESFEKTYPNLEFPPLPDQGDFDLREVLNSPYFFN